MFWVVKNIGYGVPQGSVLGLILFILYINCTYDLNVDELVATLAIIIHWYADNTCLLFFDKHWETINEKNIFSPKSSNLFYELNNKQLTLNKKINQYFITFSINNTIIPVNDLFIHTRDSIYSTKKIIRLSWIKYLGLINYWLKFEMEYTYWEYSYTLEIRNFQFL